MDEGVFKVMGENFLASWEGPGKNLANPSVAGCLQSPGLWADPGKVEFQIMGFCLCAKEWVNENRGHRSGV